MTTRPWDLAPGGPSVGLGEMVPSALPVDRFCDTAHGVAQLIAPEESVLRVLEAAVAQLHQVVKDLFYPEQTLRQLAGHALQLRYEAGIIRAAAFRDRIGIGRKRCIQLLEYFDRIGFTRRFGNERRIREDSALAQGTV